MDMLRLVLLGLAAFVALLLSWTFLQQANRSAKPPAEIATAQSSATQASPAEIAAARRGIEEKLAAATEYAGFFDRLKTLFPTEYESFLAHSSARAAAAGGKETADFLMIEAARALRLSHGVLAAKADRPALDHVFDMELAMLQALARDDQRLCVDFLYGGANGDFLKFSAENRTLFAAMASAGVDAINDGQIKRVQRPAPTAKDFQTLEQSLRAKGLDTAEIEALLDGKATDPSLDDRKMCRAGKIYLETLSALPEPARMRIYGFALELMARS
jgi:hypothetical protein